MAAASSSLTMRRRVLGAALLTLCLSAAALPARADVFVVVPIASTVKAMTQKELLDLYMGRSRAFPDGTFALPFDLPRDAPGRAAFYRALTGMELAQINSYWSRLMFSGQTLPPQPLPTEAAMVELVKRNPSAVGYVLQEPAADKGLRVVLVLKSSK
ncbi:MAG: hypothetical protein ABIR54_04720 [Burkholderiaceae bacterium]